MSSRIAVFNDGKSSATYQVQINCTKRPVNTFVAGFIGENNTFQWRSDSEISNVINVKLN